MKRKLQLTITEIRKIVGSPDSKEKSLALLILTTGIHASCIANWKQYKLQYSDSAVTWERTKQGTRSNSRIQIPWRAPLRETDGTNGNPRYKVLAHWKRRTRFGIHKALQRFGTQLKIDGLCALLLRRAYFVNQGRIGRSQMMIEIESKTRWTTIMDYYVQGANEVGMLSDDDKELLIWMYEK